MRAYGDDGSGSNGITCQRRPLLYAPPMVTGPARPPTTTTRVTTGGIPPPTPAAGRKISYAGPRQSRTCLCRGAKAARECGEIGNGNGTGHSRDYIWRGLDIIVEVGG
ncbi:hypothetical protein EDB83DRAFT_2321114 [Lactarius deliciosus]|nr:hypothetical protein EDB83DRAFT_2321114 [Lactarius deliciosus]